MKRLILADSSCDLGHNYFTDENLNFLTVPLTINLGDKQFIDDENLNIKELIDTMNSTSVLGKTACPSPDAFMQAMEKYDEVFCVTITSKLSGTYNSACIAQKEVCQRFPDKKIFVLDSKLVSSAAVLIINYLAGQIQQGLDFVTICNNVTEYRNKLSLRFVLNDLSNLAKNGRMSRVAYLVSTILPIKPILGDNGDGEIVSYAKTIGLKKAVMELAHIVQKNLDKLSGYICITHCNNIELATFLKDKISEFFDSAKIQIQAMRGLSSFYANEKGIIITF